MMTDMAHTLRRGPRSKEASKRLSIRNEVADALQEGTMSAKKPEHLELPVHALDCLATKTIARCA
jgi:hypothetical protein